ncbi:hypothetical protein [uncultured Methanolobus sp.]|uniref:hypothetical protein n=1 Tax=uncultured Methanolobus sp. TaxID=218300 RepID=UPI0029C78E99|nr:hypothetical protein [uncultured Methanolobus sp.]
MPTNSKNGIVDRSTFKHHANLFQSFCSSTAKRAIDEFFPSFYNKGKVYGAIPSAPITKSRIPKKAITALVLVLDVFKEMPLYSIFENANEYIAIPITPIITDSTEMLIKFKKLFIQLPSMQSDIKISKEHFNYLAPVFC